MSKIYVASSWRNRHHRDAVLALRAGGHDVYDFRYPNEQGPGTSGEMPNGFHWSELDPDWQNWDGERFRRHLYQHPKAATGFLQDTRALSWCDTCVLLLQCGRSAHLEAGWASGAGKRLIIVLPHGEKLEPELMYRWADGIVFDVDELVRLLDEDPDSTQGIFKVPTP